MNKLGAQQRLRGSVGALGHRRGVDRRSRMRRPIGVARLRRPDVLGLAELQRARRGADRAGSAEQHKRDGEQRRQLKALSDHLAPVLRLENRIKAHGPMPHATSVSIVPLDREWRRAVQAVRAVQVLRAAETEEQAVDPLEQEAARLAAFGHGLALPDNMIREARFAARNWAVGVCELEDAARSLGVEL